MERIRVWRIVSVVVAALFLAALPAPASAARPGPASGVRATVTSEGLPPWMEVTQVSVREESNFEIDLRVGGALPSRPGLLGYALMDWEVALDMNNTTAAAGWPRSTSTSSPPEYLVVLWWDGQQFAAGVANRTPLLTGGTPILTAVSFAIHRNEIRFLVPPAVLGNPASFGFLANAELWPESTVQIVSPTEILLGTGNDNVVAWGASAPFAHFGATNCAYTDPFGYVGGPQLNTDCYALWSRASDPDSKVVARGSPAWMNEQSTSVTGGSGRFSIAIRLQGDLPSSPDLFGNPVMLWGIGFDTNRSTAPMGWPFEGFPDSSDYMFLLWWDGAHFASMMVNRTPLLTGGSAVLTTQPISMDDNVIRFSFPAALLGNATSFGFATVAALFGISPITIVSPTKYTPVDVPLDITYSSSYEAFPPSCSYPDASGECYTTWP